MEFDILRVVDLLAGHVEADGFDHAVIAVHFEAQQLEARFAAIVRAHEKFGLGRLQSHGCMRAGDFQVLLAGNDGDAGQDFCDFPAFAQVVSGQALPHLKNQPVF